MAEITRASNISVSSVAIPPSAKISGFLAGEDIFAGAAVRMASTGKWMLSSGAAADANAVVDGFAMKKAKSGMPITIIDHPVNFNYAAGMTPGASLFLSGTVPGGLADAASTGGTKVIARVIAATRIRTKPQI